MDGLVKRREIVKGAFLEKPCECAVLLMACAGRAEASDEYFATPVLHSPPCKPVI